ncbi:hypothetical protein ACEWY4_010863 [Coilia grayii]|uniref:DUF4200 domain-containing protein n=1 Tax=Coilia grayii TaxID=363190 RepID=A0ABD1K337_9TELE
MLALILIGHRKDRESLQDYMARQKDMFMVQYALAVKKEHIQELKTASEREQLRMKHAERDLDEGAKAFEEFLKVNDQNSVDAVKLAEKEMMAKLEKTAEIKKLTSKIMTIKSDISRNQEVLNEYRAQKKFLKAVAPPEWREEQKRKRAERRRAKQTEGKNKANLHPSPSEPEIYFKDPQEMLNILADLEDQNLSYIQNFQGTEEAMEEINSELSKAKNKMLKVRCMPSLQDVMLNQLHAKVREVYRCCAGDVEFKISTLQMLASIENKMLEILDALELMPQDRVKKWKATKEKEARMRLANISV